MTSLYKNKIIVIIGATATNKTILALALAKMFDGEIINADAFQVYRELNIGVNKPTIVEMQATKFHLVSHISIKDK
jgi:tRNA dimethylallyltransferase